MPMRIAVCEDNEIHRDIMEHLLNRYSSERSVPFEFISYEYGRNFLYDMEEGAYFDAVFLDIYMDDIMGNEIAHKLRAMGYQGEIVFFTASADFAVESYDVNAGGYLLKPLDYEKLKMVMNRITRNMTPSTYQIRQRTTVTKVVYHEILYIESSNSKCILHTTSGGAYTVYKTLNTIEKELGDRRFLRCHQSFLVNMDHIRQVGKQLLLSNGIYVPIRQRGVKPVRQAYVDYLASRSTEF
ncbi:MAG: LytTR family DNA-binding domain-containing protein [Lachnospiraceae bacterium]|nr:LytTR family DNA-binding domain-containing protein [Lachnospiraceae bacterium]